MNPLDPFAILRAFARAARPRWRGIGCWWCGQCEADPLCIACGEDKA